MGSTDEGEPTGLAHRRGPFRAGDVVQLTDTKGKRHMVVLEEGRQFHTHRGAVAHSVPSDLRKAVEQTGATIRVADGDPQVELVRVHRAAIAFARLRGIDADAPPHLTRAIVHS